MVNLKSRSIGISAFDILKAFVDLVVVAVACFTLLALLSVAAPV